MVVRMRRRGKGREGSGDAMQCSCSAGRCGGVCVCGLRVACSGAVRGERKGERQGARKKGLALGLTLNPLISRLEFKVRLSRRRGTNKDGVVVRPETHQGASFLPSDSSSRALRRPETVRAVPGQRSSTGLNRDGGGKESVVSHFRIPCAHALVSCPPFTRLTVSISLNIDRLTRCEKSLPSPRPGCREGKTKRAERWSCSSSFSPPLHYSLAAAFFDRAQAESHHTIHPSDPRRWAAPNEECPLRIPGLVVATQHRHGTTTSEP